MLLRITCATCASVRDGKRNAGTQELKAGKLSSREGIAAPASPSRRAVAIGADQEPAP